MANDAISWLTAREVADMLGVSEWTVRSWARRETAGPPFYRIGGSIRYDRDEVLAFRAAQRRPGEIGARP